MRTADCRPAIYCNTSFALHITAVTVSVRSVVTSGVPTNFVRGGGGSKNSVEDRGQTEWGSGGGSPLIKGSGGSL